MHMYSMLVTIEKFNLNGNYNVLDFQINFSYETSVKTQFFKTQSRSLMLETKTMIINQRLRPRLSN